MQESVLESVTCHCLPVGDISRSSRPHTSHHSPDAVGLHISKQTQTWYVQNSDLSRDFASFLPLI